MAIPSEMRAAAPVPPLGLAGSQEGTVVTGRCRWGRSLEASPPGYHRFRGDWEFAE
jgi:hypothetical protein